MKTLRLVLLTLVLVLAAGCRDNGADDSNTPAQVQPTRQIVLVLQPSGLADYNGQWLLDETSVNLDSQTDFIAMTAAYGHTVKGIRGNLKLTVFSTYAEAQRVFEEQLAAWQADSNNTVKKIDALADASYTLNTNQSALSLVDGNGVVTVEFVDGGTQTDLDLLGLLQVGINAVRERDVPIAESGGSLGSATLAPP